MQTYIAIFALTDVEYSPIILYTCRITQLCAIFGLCGSFFKFLESKEAIAKDRLSGKLHKTQEKKSTYALSLITFICMVILYIIVIIDHYNVANISARITNPDKGSMNCHYVFLVIEMFTAIFAWMFSSCCNTR